MIKKGWGGTKTKFYQRVSKLWIWQKVFTGKGEMNLFIPDKLHLHTFQDVKDRSIGY